MATTQLRLDQLRLEHDNVRLWTFATGNPLVVDLHRLTRKGARWTSEPVVKASPAHVRELLAAGWVPTGDVEAFFAAVAAGASDDPFAGVGE